MKYDTPLAQGTLVRRYKRFLADITTLAGKSLTVHCPNTGAMLGCATPGAEVWYSDSNNPKRKYRHTLEAVATEFGMAGINSALANKLVAEALATDAVLELTGYTKCQPEVRSPIEAEKRSRFDFFLSEHHAGAADCYVEVKSVTYARPAGLGLFPDAVSERALRHVQELMAVRALGSRAVLLFCAQHQGIERIAPAVEIQPAYAAALLQAQAAGVELLGYGVQLGLNGSSIERPLEVVLP